MLFLNRRAVEALLDLDQLIDALAPAMADLSAGRVSMPLRVAAAVPERDGVLAAMPAYLPSTRTLATKLVSVFPRNAELGLPTHEAILIVFDSATGSPLAIMDGAYLTAARTAAGSALATRLLGRSDADVLVILGTGVQARMHARVIPQVRPIPEVRVVGRDPRKVKALAGELGAPARPFDSLREAARGAGIICAATHCLDPVVIGRWLEPGVHINSVGFNPQGRELDDETIAKSALLVESRQAALAPFPAGSSDLAAPIRAGLIVETQIAEIGELVSGARPGRASPEQITVYKSVGVAAQDAVAAALVLAAARQKGVGREIDLS